jgi:hypothetical protein
MSDKLRCSAENCYNNVNQLCIANVIHVTGSQAHNTPETACDTFIEKSDVTGTSQFTNRNLSEDFSQLFSGETSETSPQISCDAENCTHNFNGMCSANYVEIQGVNARTIERTECETFRES